MSILISGKAYYARIIGEPHPNKFKDGATQWTFDLSVTPEEAEKLLKAGMKQSYVRNKQDERGAFISFVRDAVKKDGTPAKPFKIVDSQNREWDQNRLIGNGSVLNVAVVLNERVFRGEKFLKPSAIAIQVWDHSPYQAKSGFPEKEAVLADIDLPVKEEETSW